jgi:hypothetical protein
MIEKPRMQSLLENMERAAGEILQRDAAFFEVLQALKNEIEANSRVQSAMRALRASGQKTFTSFVPRLNIRVRTERGLVGVTSVGGMPNTYPQLQALTDELRSAASAVIQSSSRRNELNAIVNEAIGSSEVFEGIASQIEREGHEIVICLDFSACTQVQTGDTYARISQRTSSWAADLAKMPLSDFDLGFLRTLGIRADR